jgi:chromate transporter
MPEATLDTAPSLSEIVRGWGRIGCTGFGGPAVHIALLREMCVAERGWIEAKQFERALAAVNMLPGPASTQLAIYCAWRLRGRLGALVGGLCFIAPGLILVIALSTLFLAKSPPLWVRGAGLGAGAAVPAVAIMAGLTIGAPMWRRIRGHARVRSAVYAVAGAGAAATLGPGLVLVLLACGAIELAWQSVGSGSAAMIAWPLLRGWMRGELGAERRAWVWLPAQMQSPLRVSLLAAVGTGGLGALAWTALKVGALAFGGGFVIVPLMQTDAVQTYHWMTHAQFLNAVALGQITPGPITQTVAAVGYAAGGLPAALLASLVAYLPSFSFVLLGATGFERLLASRRVRAFLAGAAPAAVGAIAGSAIPLTAAIGQTWQYAVLAAAAIVLLALRGGVVIALLAAGLAGVVAVLLLGAPA